MLDLDLRLSPRSVAVAGGPKAIPQSEALTAFGPGITAVLGADGFYTITTTGASTLASYAVTADDAFAADYLAEIEIVTHANGAWGGFDNGLGGAIAHTSADEDFFPDAGFGANKINYYKNGALTNSNVTFTGTKVYMERVGTVVKFYQGETWDAAKITAALITSTATDGTARSFHFGINTAGISAVWRVRVRNHPG